MPAPHVPVHSPVRRAGRGPDPRVRRLLRRGSRHRDGGPVGRGGDGRAVPPHQEGRPAVSEVERLERRLERERQARKAAEAIAEEKTREIYETNVRLQRLNDRLEELVRQRTAELAATRDEAVRASQAKSAFLANMSHELRTPLNAIIGYSEMLLEEAAELGQEEFLPDLQKINTAGKHLLALINDILDLAKIEAGHFELRLIERVRPDDLTRGCADLLRENARAREIELSVDIQPALPDIDAD